MSKVVSNLAASGWILLSWLVCNLANVYLLLSKYFRSKITSANLNFRWLKICKKNFPVHMISEWASEAKHEHKIFLVLDVASSEPSCKNVVVLSHPRESNDMPPKSLQLNTFLHGEGRGGGRFCPPNVLDVITLVL